MTALVFCCKHPFQLNQAGLIQVLGRQKLTDLRDVIRCVNDLTVSGDLSENPDMENHLYAKVKVQLCARTEKITFINNIHKLNIADDKVFLAKKNVICL